MEFNKRQAPMRKGLVLLLLMLIAILLLGCPGNDGDDDNSTGGSESEAPIGEQVDTSGDYIEVTDSTEREALVQEIWQVLISASCWDSSFITDPIFTGEYAGSVMQLSFSGSDQYRYVGVMDIYFGTIVLYSVGHYRGYMTAIVETWSGDTEAIIIVDDNQIAHVILHLDGSPIVTEYGASNGTCL